MVVVWRKGIFIFVLNQSRVRYSLNIAAEEVVVSTDGCGEAADLTMQGAGGNEGTLTGKAFVTNGTIHLKRVIVHVSGSTSKAKHLFLF